MAAAGKDSSRGRRRRLTVPERYQVFLDVVSGAGSQRDIADSWRIDRTTVAHVCKVAKQGALDALAANRPGRPGKTAAELALEDALIAVLDLVSRYWIASLTSSEETSEQVTAAYTLALEDQGLLGEAERRMIAPNSDEALPILLAASDNGPQMVSGTTREWLALHSLAWHTGRPGTPTDQAHIESFFGHVKGECPELEHITDPATLDRELERVRFEYNTVRLHGESPWVSWRLLSLETRMESWQHSASRRRGSRRRGGTRRRTRRRRSESPALVRLRVA